jgi:hypothetical protein
VQVAHALEPAACIEAWKRFAHPTVGTPLPERQRQSVFVVQYVGLVTSSVSGISSRMAPVARSTDTETGNSDGW